MLLLAQSEMYDMVVISTAIYLKCITFIISTWLTKILYACEYDIHLILCNFGLVKRNINNSTSLSIASWNGQGITSKIFNKLDDSIFINELQKHHIIGLQETHGNSELILKVFVHIKLIGRILGTKLWRYCTVSQGRTMYRYNILSWQM